MAVHLAPTRPRRCELEPDCHAPERGESVSEDAGESVSKDELRTALDAVRAALDKELSRWSPGQ